MEVDMLHAAGSALLIILDWHRLIFLFAGVCMGLSLGLLPGIGGVAGTALLLPFTYNMDAHAAFGMLLGLGSTTTTADPISAILFGAPGHAASAATTLDGYPMTRRGEAGRALGASYMSALIGGLFGAALMALALPILRPIILYIGSPELLSVAVFGISMVSVLSGSAPLRGLTAACFGMMLAMIGTDPQSGTLRWTLDTLYLWDGMPLVPFTLGIFALPELCDLAISRMAVVGQGQLVDTKTGMLLGVKDCMRHWFLILRCSWIGSAMGAIPGIGASVIDWISYGHALKTEKGAAQTFGKGDVRGVIAAESATNSREGGALVPTVAFGVPSSAGMAILLGAFLIHGLVPGTGHAHQASRHHLFDGVEHRDRQHPGLRTLLPVQRPAREARDAALHADHAVRPEPDLHRRIRGIAQLGRSLRAVVLRHARLGHEAFQMAAPAAGAGLHPGRHPRALHVHLDRALRHILDAAPGRHGHVHHGGIEPDGAAPAGHPRASRSQGDADGFRPPAHHHRTICFRPPC